MKNLRIKSAVASIELTTKEIEALEVASEVCQQVWQNTCANEVEERAGKAKEFLWELIAASTSIVIDDTDAE